MLCVFRVALETRMDFQRPSAPLQLFAHPELASSGEQC